MLYSDWDVAVQQDTTLISVFTQDLTEYVSMWTVVLLLASICDPTHYCGVPRKATYVDMVIWNKRKSRPGDPPQGKAPVALCQRLMSQATVKQDQQPTYHQLKQACIVNSIHAITFAP